VVSKRGKGVGFFKIDALDISKRVTIFVVKFYFKRRDELWRGKFDLGDHLSLKR